MDLEEVSTTVKTEGDAVTEMKGSTSLTVKVEPLEETICFDCKIEETAQNPTVEPGLIGFEGQPTASDKMSVTEGQSFESDMNEIENLYTCDKCLYTTAHEGGLKVHQRIHADKLYTCEHCSFSTAQTSAFSRHVNSQKHVPFKALGKTPVSEVGCSQQRNGGKKFPCAGDGSEERPVSDVVVADITEDDGESFRSMGKERKRKFLCDSCPYAAPDKSKLTVHQRKHTGEKPFACEQCSFTAAEKSNVKKHVKQVHEGERGFRCDTCSHVAVSKSNLTIHQRKHTGEKPFVCDQCSFVSAQKGHLTAHKRVHSGEKPFTCDQCTYAAAQKSSITQHVKQVHLGERKFPCDTCSHVAVNKYTLTVHQRKHTGERPFTCEQCPYATARKADLTRHVRGVHSKEDQV